MSGNTFGKLFSVTTFGESHGTALGCIIDGCPPGLELSSSDLQHALNRRKPGTEASGSMPSGTGRSPLKLIGHSDASCSRLAGNAAQLQASP